MSTAFTWETAAAAAQSNALEALVHDFLRGPGTNIPLSDGLHLEPRGWHGPLLFPRGSLSRICGPEPAMKYRQEPETFERRVRALVDLLQDGWAMPPLIVNFGRGRFELTDGNHRHEALARVGRPEVPVIVWTTGADDDFEFRSHPLAQRGAARQAVVGTLVIRPDGRIFAQKRSAGRKTFPGCWDLVGGHVEAGETAREALARELREETGWTLDTILGLRRIVDWEAPGEHGPVLKREYVVAVTIAGGWDAPVLETGKVTEGRWFGPGDLAVLNENRGSDTYVHDLFREEFAR